jgi:hypothetical protein
VFKKDERINKYNIHQNLHSYTLDKLTSDTRRIIVGFYSKCEEFYVDGVQIYDAIVQNQLKYTTIKQVENSNVLLEKIVNDDENREIEKNDIESESESESESEEDREIYDLIKGDKEEEKVSPITLQK